MVGSDSAFAKIVAEAEHGLAAEGPTAVVLSHAFWQQRLGGDEAVLGRELALEPPSNFGVPFAATGSLEVPSICPQAPRTRPAAWSGTPA